MEIDLDEDVNLLGYELKAVDWLIDDIYNDHVHTNHGTHID